MELFLHIVEQLASMSYQESTVPSWEPLSVDRKYKVPPKKTLEAIMKIKNSHLRDTSISW